MNENSTLSTVNVQKIVELSLEEDEPISNVDTQRIVELTFET